MASCTQVEGLLQGYVDGELEASERVILERHVSECGQCALRLRNHQRMAAELFELLGPERLPKKLRQPVLDNLPDMEGAGQNIEDVNWRAKHPTTLWGRVARQVPAAALVLLVLTAAIMKAYWPDPAPAGEAIGVVLQRGEPANLIKQESTDRGEVDVARFVEAGQSYETGSGGSLMLALAGSSYVKLNEWTRVRVMDERKLRLEQGDIWMDVGHDGRLFKIMVPGGSVTVFGTVFGVSVNQSETRVTVESGEVQVENGAGFRLLTEGQEIRMLAEEAPGRPETAASMGHYAWRAAITPDIRASEIFERELAQLHPSRQLSAQEVYMIDVSRGGGAWDVGGLRIGWDDAPAGPHADYEVFVYDERMNPVYRTEFRGSVFALPGRRHADIPVDREAIAGVNVLMVRLVPLPGAGRPAERLEVSALAY